MRFGEVRHDYCFSSFLNKNPKNLKKKNIPVNNPKKKNTPKNDLNKKKYPKITGRRKKYHVRCQHLNDFQDESITNIKKDRYAGVKGIRVPLKCESPSIDIYRVSSVMLSVACRDDSLYLTTQGGLAFPKDFYSYHDSSKSIINFVSIWYDFDDTIYV